MGKRERGGIKGHSPLKSPGDHFSSLRRGRNSSRRYNNNGHLPLAALLWSKETVSIRTQIPDVWWTGPSLPTLVPASCSRNTCAAACCVAGGGMGGCSCAKTWNWPERIMVIFQFLPLKLQAFNRPWFPKQLYQTDPPPPLLAHSCCFLLHCHPSIPVCVCVWVWDISLFKITLKRSVKVL